MIRISIAAMVFAGWCTGCHSVIVSEPPRTQHYYINPQANFSTVGRVALLELENSSSQPDLAETMTDELADELGKRHLFSIRRVRRSEPLWNAHELDNLKSHTLEDLADARRALNADAILFGDIRRYASFPHLQIGLNLRMIDTRSGHLIWAIEEIWDSSDKTLERRMKTYFRERLRGGYEPMDWHILTTSPRAFHQFVAYEVSQTLPDLPEKVVPRTVEYRRRYWVP